MHSSLPSSTVLAQTPNLIDLKLSILTQTLLSASKNIPLKKYQSLKRPGWGPTVKAARRSYKHAHRLWVNAGRPRDPNHPARLSYKQAKRVFSAHIWLHMKPSTTPYILTWIPTASFNPSAATPARRSTGRRRVSSRWMAPPLRAQE